MTQPRLLGGRYELDGVVGRGGMAEVYRARDIRLDRIVAVKTLREDLARDQTFQARFRREAQSAASLNHPSIVAVYDTGEDMAGPTPVPYIVMEYVDGRTLRDLLRDDRRLLPERALEITDGVLRALDYSHRNGIVHRDIKPGNVMLTRPAEVKVMDFGIARAVSDTQATMTQTAQVIGTAQYLSPEQARGERVDARSDLYSTGCLLYELLTGRPPFTGDSPVAIAYQHVRENPIPPSRVDPEIPAVGRRDRAQGDGQGPGRPLPVGRRDAHRHPARAVRGAGGRAAATEMYAPGHAADGPADHDGRRGRADRHDVRLRRAGRRLRRRHRRRPPPGAVVDPRRGRRDHRRGAGLPAAERRQREHRLGAVRGGPDPVPRPSRRCSGPGWSRSVVNVPSSDKVGIVVSSNPQFGTKVAPHSKVTLRVSAGPKKVTIPNVVGQSEGQAQSTLQGLGLNVTTKTDPTSTAGPGQGGQDGSAARHPGEAGQHGDAVRLRRRRPVPSVIGDPKSTAESILSNAGFQVKVVTVAGPAGSTPGTVFNQQPSNGTTAPTGSTVTIFVAAATQPTTPPTSASPTPTAPATPTPTGSRDSRRPPSGGRR